MKHFTLIVVVLSSFAHAQELRLWYTKPAKQWEEALPIGSGRLGAMVFGGVAEERIQFNEDTLWAGKPHDYVRAGAGESLAEIRHLVFEGKEKDVTPLVRTKFLSDPVRQKAYQPFGDLRLSFAGQDDASDYRRELDLDSAVARVRYRVGKVEFTREVFASYPDNVIVVRIAASEPGSVSVVAKLTTPHKSATTQPLGTDTIAMRGQVRDVVPPNEAGMTFEARLRGMNSGGTLSASDEGIKVAKADAVTLVLVAATSFKNFQDISGDPAQRCEEYLAKLGGKSYESLRDNHVADFQRLFQRVTLNLGAQPALPTDQLLKKVDDPSLAALYFQMGRYMLISSSRPHAQPANLQGVWNELINPPWESKYTTNINVEMNYWPAEVANLSDCAEPLFDMIDDLRISGARTAKKQYNARGWVVHHNTDLWRGSAPINNIDGVWPTGGAWLCYHLWEHYLFTGDKDFLAKRAYPAMKEAALFFVDSLVKDPHTGFLVTNPSFSPEQGGLCAGPAMDMQLVRALFDSTTEAAGILGVDKDLCEQITATRKQLAPDKIGKHGQLQEWQEDVDQPDNNHRHMSPLWGLYPGAQFTPMEPKLFDAAKVLLKWRGDGSTGWSYAWRMPLWARVHDGNFAYRQLSIQLAKRTFPNLFDKCGPFQVDGDFGACAGIAEMLLQSHVRPSEDFNLYEIDLLPALPKAWANGSVTGLCARGGFEVDMQWEGGKLTKAAVRSKLGNPCRVRYGEKTMELKTEKGQTYDVHK